MISASHAAGAGFPGCATLASTGRFLTPDPIGLEGGTNPYVYVGSNPVNYRDPFGLLRNATFTTQVNPVRYVGPSGSTSMMSDQSRFPIQASCPNRCTSGDLGLEVLGAYRQAHILSGGSQGMFTLGGPLGGASGDLPFYKTDYFGYSRVQQYNGIIENASRHVGIEADLIRAVMYTENVPGQMKDDLLSLVGEPTTIQPMNVGVGWATRFGHRPEDLAIPSYNILVGAEILAGIQRNLGPNASVSAIYSIYKDLRSTNIHEEALHVEAIHRSKPWLEK